MQVIQEIPFDQSKHRIIFSDSQLAHQYCTGYGLEIGAAAHNPFHLADCLNVADEAGFEFYKQAQIDMCGAWVGADVMADAAKIPFGDSVEDYIISSHMIEHHPDPIACFVEWNRLVKDGGIIFMIFPKRDALPSDGERPITDLKEIVAAHKKKLTVETAPEPPGGKGGHYYVYTLDLMKRLIDHCALKKGLDWEILVAAETDDKVGNGHCIVVKVHKETANDLGSSTGEQAAGTPDAVPGDAEFVSV